MGMADASHITSANEQAGEPESRPATHQVSRDDGLLKIAATYYPDNKDLGYDAIILANPGITNEDVIYPGQTIALPRINKSNSIIALDSKGLFKAYGRYYNSSQAEKVGAKLKELQVRYVVRETELPNDVKVYRIFIGGYESKEELQRVLALTEKN